MSVLLNKLDAAIQRTTEEVRSPETRIFRRAADDRELFEAAAARIRELEKKLEAALSPVWPRPAG